MANIFYDRSGKAHAISGKTKTDSEDSKSESKKDPKTDSAKKSHGHKKSKNQGDSRTQRNETRNERQTPARGGFVRAAKSGADRGPTPNRDDRGPRPNRDVRSDQKPTFEKKSKWEDRGSKSGRKDGGSFGARDSGGARGTRGNSGGKGKFTKRRGPPQDDRAGKDYSRKKFGRGQSTGKGQQTLKGVIDKNKRGSAFLVLDRLDMEDIFIPRFYLEQVFHGDRVEAVISDRGEIENIKILQHRFKEIFGRVHFDEEHGGPSKKTKTKTRTGYLVYERKKAKEEVFLPAIPPEVKEFDWVRAEMVFSEESKEAPIANIKEVIGAELPASYDVQMVAGEFNLKELHSFDAIKQAESYTLDVAPVGSAQKGKDEECRTDLRHLPFITIDGERARDFDDAVYVERKGKGFVLWVAIADVSHYVKEGTPLDREAFERSTSVYFPERAFHMLPRALSEELCSLKPHVPRMAMATSIEYSEDGTKGEIKLYNAIIESRRRSTYTEIQAEKDDPKHADLFALYRILRAARTERGSIDFDFPEAEIILDEKTGEPSDILVRERQDAHRLIEEMMIAANESVTEYMLAKKRPFIYRIHEEPSPEAILKFTKLSKTMGVPFMNKGGIPKPKVLADFVKQLAGHPAEPVLANALLRSMRQAIYTATHTEHYGLASEGYTHFTSPIRRYPDLVVHRLLRATLAGEPTANDEELEQITEHCSYRERIASEAERESIRFKQVRLMSKLIGEEREGKITGVSDRGMFVQLWHPYCEGMVPVDSMQDDWYEYQEERMVLVGRKKKRSFTIGMKVNIQVVRVDMDARQVEFQLLEDKK